MTGRSRCASATRCSRTASPSTPSWGTCGSGCERGSRTELATRLDGHLRGRVRGHAGGGPAARAGRPGVPSPDRSALGVDRVVGVRRGAGRGEPGAAEASMSRRRSVGGLAVLALVAAACTDDGIGIEFGSPTSPSAATPSASAEPGDGPGIALNVDPVRTGEARAIGAMRELCVGPTPTSTDDDGAPRETPADVVQLESQVEQVRELEFLRDVVVQPVSADEIAGKLEGAFDE